MSISVDQKAKNGKMTFKKKFESRKNVKHDLGYLRYFVACSYDTYNSLYRLMSRMSTMSTQASTPPLTNLLGV